MEQSHEQDERNAEQSPGLGGLRYPVQQTRLLGSRTLLVAHLHPAQRAHRSRPRGPLQPHQERAADAEIRARGDRGRWRPRHRSWAVFGVRGTRELDRGGHPPDRGWCPYRTLGRHPGRGDSRAIQERQADVRRLVPGLSRRTLMTTPVVLITGALTGIGRATALAFAQEGAHLVVSGRREEEGEKLVAELRKLGAEPEFVRSDVRHGPEIRSLVDKTVARFGRLDVAVNNAGPEGKPGPGAEQHA